MGQGIVLSNAIRGGRLLAGSKFCMVLTNPASSTVSSTSTSSLSTSNGAVASEHLLIPVQKSQTQLIKPANIDFGLNTNSTSISNPLLIYEDSDIKLDSTLQGRTTNMSYQVELASPLLSSSFVTLNLVAVLWGTQHLVIQRAVHEYPATSVSVLARFLVSSLIFLPAIGSALSVAWSGMPRGASSGIESTSDAIKNDESGTSIFAAGVELGVYTFLGFALQAVGLETTSAGRSAFLLYLNVKLVPFFAAVLYNRSISGRTWLSALSALAGTALLSSDGGPHVIGEVWCVAAAAASAMFILRLETHSSNKEAAPLNGVSLITVSLLSAAWVAVDLWRIACNSAETVASVGEMMRSILDLASEWTNIVLSDPWPTLYLGVVISGLCGYLQAVGQRGVPAERAALVYAMDPVYAALFSWVLAGQSLGVQGIVGGALVMVGVWLGSGTGSEVRT